MVRSGQGPSGVRKPLAVTAGVWRLDARARRRAVFFIVAAYPMIEKTINLRGLKCPLPALRTRKALKAVAAGDVIVVECTDPLAAIDIPNLLRQTGDALESSASADGVLTFRIRKA